MAMVLLVSGALLAQEAKVTTAPKSFLAFHAGPSFAVDAFGSTSINNKDAGFAKTGVNLNLFYGYQFQKDISMMIGVLYNYNSIQKGGVTIKDETGNQEVVINMDHWQMYGVAAGPMLSLSLGKNVYTDLKVMAGAVNVNAPQMSYQGINLTKENWNVAAVLQGGAYVRVDAGKKMFVMAGADYMYLKPTFKYEFNGSVNAQLSSDYFKQRMTMVNVTAGVGYRF